MKKFLIKQFFLDLILVIFAMTKIVYDRKDAK